MFGLPQQVWIQSSHVFEALHLAIEGVDQEQHLFVVLAEGVGHEVERRLLDLNQPAAGVAQREELGVHRFGHVPDHLALVLVFLRVDVEEQRHHLRAARAKADGLARLRLRHPPELRVAERPVLDLVHHVRPAPAGVDLVQQRAWRIVKPRGAGFLGLQLVAREPRPPLDRIVMPRAAGQVLVAVVIAVRQDVEPGPLLVADDHRQRVLELLAEADIHHARVEGLAPHADVEPARPRPGAGDGAGKNQVGGGGEHGGILGRTRPSGERHSMTGLPPTSRAVVP